MWDEITYTIPNFNGATVQISEWVNDFITHFTGYVIHDGIKKKPWRNFLIELE